MLKAVQSKARAQESPLSSPVVTQLHPDNVLEMQLLPSLTVIAKPATIRHIDVQAVRVEGSRAGLTAKEAPP